MLAVVFSRGIVAYCGILSTVVSLKILPLFLWVFVLLFFRDVQVLFSGLKDSSP